VENQRETAENKPDRVSRSPLELTRLEGVRPVSPEVERGRGAEPTDAELERAIIDSVTMGAVDVARLLAARLEERRHATAGNVVAMRPRPKGGP
jgi:hypothetical protein